MSDPEAPEVKCPKCGKLMRSWPGTIHDHPTGERVSAWWTYTCPNDEATASRTWSPEKGYGE